MIMMTPLIMDPLDFLDEVPFMMVTIPSLLLIICAWFDHKYMKVPDVVVSFGWFWLVISAFIFDNFDVLAILAGSFAVMFFVNSIVNYYKEAILGWGDILGVPIFAAVLHTWAGVNLLLAGMVLSMAFSVVILPRNEKGETPFYVAMAMTLIFYAVFVFVNSLMP
jgi:hypothetical protein